MLAQPRELNARLGLYTNFVNLLQLCGLAVPSGFRADGLPSGITLIGLPDSDAKLASFGAAFQQALAGPLGTTGRPAPAVARGPRRDDTRAAPRRSPRRRSCWSRWWGRTCRDSRSIISSPILARDWRAPAGPRRSIVSTRFPVTTPPKPGLVRVPADGAAIEVEVWRIERTRFGDFFARVPPPLCLGTIELEDGVRVSGFLCETYATAGARDISALGGWRAFLAAAGAA